MRRRPSSRWSRSSAAWPLRPEPRGRSLWAPSGLRPASAAAFCGIALGGDAYAAVHQALTSRPPMGALLGYLDPGSGSMILQMLAGGTAAVAVVGKLYWKRLKNLFRIGKR